MGDGGREGGSLGVIAAAWSNRTTHAHFDIRSIDLLRFPFVVVVVVALCEMQAHIAVWGETSFIMYSERMSGVGRRSENCRTLRMS